MHWAVFSQLLRRKEARASPEWIQSLKSSSGVTVFTIKAGTGGTTGRGAGANFFKDQIWLRVRTSFSACTCGARRHKMLGSHNSTHN